MAVLGEHFVGLNLVYGDSYAMGFGWFDVLEEAWARA